LDCWLFTIVVVVVVVGTFFGCPTQRVGWEEENMRPVVFKIGLTPLKPPPSSSTTDVEIRVGLVLGIRRPSR